MIDAIAEIGDKPHLLAGLGDHRGVDRVGDGWYQNIGFAHRLDDLGLRHWLVFEVEASVEQLAHAGFDEVGQPPRHHHKGFFLGHERRPLRPRGAVAAAPTSTIRVPAFNQFTPRLRQTTQMFAPRRLPRVPVRRVGGLSSRRAGKDKDGRSAVEEVGMKRHRRPISVLGFARRGVLTMLSALILAPGLAAADPVGSVTKLPLPRFASLKTDRVNLREGPSKDHATKWVYERAGLPVEITAEFEIWRRVRDSEGVEGWVLHSLLSGRRTALVTPNKKGENSEIYARPSDSAELAATLQSGVIVNIRNCDGAWCLVDGDGFKGYIEQVKLWGVYPNEKVE